VEVRVVGGGVGLLSRAFEGDAARAGEPTLVAVDGDPRWTAISGRWIGAGVTLARLAADPRIAEGWPAIAVAAAATANPNLRRRITVGGVVAARLPTSDLAAPLCAHGAMVRLHRPFDDTPIDLPLGEYLADGPAGVVTGVVLAEPAPSAYRRVAVRQGPAPAIATVCAVQGPTGLRRWAGAVATVPIELTEHGEVPADVVLLSDHRASADYRRTVVRNLAATLLVPWATAPPLPDEVAAGAVPPDLTPPVLRVLPPVHHLEVDGRVLDLPEPVPAAQALSDVLRRFGVLSVKVGCEEGVCGACTVQLDGEPVPSCVLPVGTAAGRRIRTASTLVDTAEGRRLVEELDARCSLQCGFCAPGLVATATALLRSDRDALDLATCTDALAGQLCRCTGSWPLVEAVLAAASPDPDTKENRP